MYNSVTLIGRVGTDMDNKAFESLNRISRFSFCTWENVDIDGETTKKTSWHNVEAWNGLSDICRNNIKKGDFCMIQGTIKYNKYVKDNVEITRTMIVLFSIKKLAYDKTH